jgi:hypothetical protein
MTKDPEFLAAAADLKIEIDPLSASDLMQAANDLRDIPEAIKERARRLLEG